MVLHVSSGQCDVPKELLQHAGTLTARKMNYNFGGDIGMEAMGIRFHPAAVKLQTGDHSGSVSISINSLDFKMKDFTLDHLTKFTNRDGAYFIEAKMPYGVRQFIFNPMPFTMPAVISRNETSNHICIEFILLKAPKNTTFYICFGEIETVKCGNCGKHAQHMPKCARCKCTRYCSKECQKADKAKHRLICYK